ncbi:hypothetical protein RRG08_028449 [Elysia crispata]|uniref:Uncharacterized protein n=1 Tax=Elysia crispata TaxID=231223 RepID=A0AAE1AU24_9GAST|nr:hypothetical protein RRG08_028449 [Elysia crispata]
MTGLCLCSPRAPGRGPQATGACGFLPGPGAPGRGPQATGACGFLPGAGAPGRGPLAPGACGFLPGPGAPGRGPQVPNTSDYFQKFLLVRRAGDHRPEGLWLFARACGKDPSQRTRLLIRCYSNRPDR